MTDSNKNINYRYRFYALFSLLMIAMFLKYALLIDFPSILFVGIMAIIAFFGDRDEIIATCMCCIPLYTAVPYHYVIVFCLMMYLVKYGKSEFRFDLGIVPILLIIVWELLHCLSGEINFAGVIVAAIPYVILAWFFSVRGLKSLNYAFVTRTFALSVLMVCLILTVRLMILCDFKLDVAFLNMNRLGLSDEAAGDLIINPNTLGIQCVLAISCLLQLRTKGGKELKDIALMIMIIVLGALTVSRTYFVCLIIAFGYLFVVSEGGIRKKAGLLFGVLVITLICILTLSLLFPTVLELFVQRFQEDDITSGRDSLFNQYNDYIFSSAKSFLWGIGTYDMLNKVIHVYEISDNVPHNGIQEVFVAWGLPGMMFLISMVLVLMQRSRQENPHQKKINYLPFIILFAKIQVGQMITSPYTMLAFALIYISLCADLSSTEHLEKVDMET